MRSLLSLADPHVVTPLLTTAARRAYGRDVNVAEVKATVVRDQFGEHRNLALLYELALVRSGRRTSRRWRGNANADIATVRRRHQVLSRLYQQLPRGTVPRPIAFSQQCHLSLYEEVSGATPQQLFDGGQKQAGLTARAAERLVEWR